MGEFATDGGQKYCPQILPDERHRENYYGLGHNSVAGLVVVLTGRFRLEWIGRVGSRHIYRLGAVQDSRQAPIPGNNDHRI